MSRVSSPIWMLSLLSADKRTLHVYAYMTSLVMYMPQVAPIPPPSLKGKTLLAAAEKPTAKAANGIANGHANGHANGIKH
jgi:hypothetical protein